MEENAKAGKAEKTRGRLLKIALKEFNRRGFDEVSMRDLAQAADLSPGAFYYHFKSKEEIVQVYYEGTLEVFITGAREIFTKTKKFEERLKRVMHLRIETFRDHRELLVALSRVAVDPRSELSPFGEGTREIRERTVQVFTDLIDGSDLKYDTKLEPYLPTLLWMYLMGMVFFWVFDSSKNQTITDQFIDKCTLLLSRLIRFSGFPFTGRVMDPILDLLKLLWMPRRLT